MAGIHDPRGFFGPLFAENEGGGEAKGWVDVFFFFLFCRLFFMREGEISSLGEITRQKYLGPFAAFEGCAMDS